MTIILRTLCSCSGRIGFLFLILSSECCFLHLVLRRDTSPVTFHYVTEMHLVAISTCLYGVKIHFSSRRFHGLVCSCAFTARSGGFGENKTARSLAPDVPCVTFLKRETNVLLKTLFVLWTQNTSRVSSFVMYTVEYSLPFEGICLVY